MLKFLVPLALAAFFIPAFAMESSLEKNQEEIDQINFSESPFLNGEPNSVPVVLLDILVIDDNKINLVIMERMLRELGCRDVTLVESAEMAIELIKGKAEKNTFFGMIFTDINMPGMDGMDCTREIRKIPYMKSVPIIAVTTEEEIEERCLASGINDFMPKPFTKVHLNQVLTRALLNQ